MRVETDITIWRIVSGLLAQVDQPAAAKPEQLILAAVLGVAALLVLVLQFRMHAFVALLLISFAVGLGAGMSPDRILTTVEKGMGGVLGFVAIVVGLGSMFGKMLEVSGGAETLAKTMLEKVGDAKAQWALGIIGFVLSIPIFLDVALIIVIPIIYGLTRRTGKPLLYFGIPLLAGLAVTHSFIPPTPGPVLVAQLVKADLGWVILFGTIAGLPAMVIAGPLFGKFIAYKVPVGIPDFIEYEEPAETSTRPLPGFGLVLMLILLPLALILFRSMIDYIVDPGSTVAMAVRFIGHPFIALLIATLVAGYSLGKHLDYSREQVSDTMNKALEPAGIIILVTGAGGVFKQVLFDSGIGPMLGDHMRDLALSPILLAFVITALIRVAQGSATVAMVTAGGIMAPINVAFGLVAGVDAHPHAAPLLGLEVIAIACGATVLSHVNDSGFWLVNRFFGMTVAQTLKTWTIMETIVGLVGFAIVYGISLTLF